MGVSDFLPKETADFEAILTTLSVVFSGLGYQKIHTPTLEYFDTLALGMGDSFGHLAVKLFDASGQVMVLRPDHTVPIARMVATRMRHAPLPIKLWYMNPIFRSLGVGFDTNQEIFQAGLELIGDPGVAADVAVISACCDSFLALGYRDFILDIGHVDFVNEFPDSLREALLRQDYVALGQIPARGGVELVADYPQLCALYEGLKAKGYDQYVVFNKGLVKALDYYTGMLFEVAIPGFTRTVASGGRYDGLLGKFGFDCPSVGFAISVSDLKQGETE